MGVTGTWPELPERALNIVCISLKFLPMSAWNPPTIIRYLQKFCVRNFRVTISSFISNAHHIFTVYNITSKQSLYKKISLFCAKRKFFNNEKFANYGIMFTYVILLC